MKILSRTFHLLSTLIALGFVSTLRAQSPQNPLPISGPTTITTSGYYRLTHNIVSSATSGNIITIQAHNVTIDFNTFFIVGPKNPANTVIGISANEFGNLTIKNGTIAFCQIGIQLSGNNNPATTHNINQVIENMRISNCYSFGVYFSDSSPGSVVSNCLFSQIGGSTDGSFPSGVGVFGSIADPTLLVKDNIINKVTGSSAFPTVSYGILYAIAVRNAISNSFHGVTGGKYQNNLTSNVIAPFSSGTDAGGNN
jgi:hypothetical protein